MGIARSLDDSRLKISIFCTRLLQESLYRVYLYTAAWVYKEVILMSVTKVIRWDRTKYHTLILWY